ncbi:MAG: CTP synthase [Candidatus Bipolaricaulia bacterium]
MRKFIFVTGGVLSGLGKGVVTASIGLLLKAQGHRVSLQKIDPYVNVDAGTMNPYEHGEVFVTQDGKETDLDIGRYERFLDESLTAAHYFTTGQVYGDVIRQERAGAYLGKTVQVIPHVTDEIKRLIRLPLELNEAEIGVIEVGGTVGDIEGLPFLEALRQMRDELPREDTFFIHVTLLPHLSSSDEMKTKPTQHSVKELRAIGIQPDAIVARADRPLPEPVKEKIALFCDVPRERVIEDPDLPSIYHAPLIFQEQALPESIASGLNLPPRTPELTTWREHVKRIESPSRSVRIAIVGKYVELTDSYISIREALVHAGASEDIGVEIDWIAAETIAKLGPEACLVGVDGLLIPGGFGHRGIEGKVEAVEFVRTNRVPFFGICLGLQCAVIEYARNVLALEGANSSEFDPDSPHPVIALLEEQEDVIQMGGTMRRGIYETVLADGSVAQSCYGERTIEERHRHRYEFNPAYVERFEAAGMRIAGTTTDGLLAEIVEIGEHPWFVSVQFHPEFTSHFLRAHPLFVGFVRACQERNSSSSAS